MRVLIPAIQAVINTIADPLYPPVWGAAKASRVDSPRFLS